MGQEIFFFGYMIDFYSNRFLGLLFVYTVVNGYIDLIGIAWWL